MNLRACCDKQSESLAHLLQPNAKWQMSPEFEESMTTMMNGLCERLMKRASLFKDYRKGTPDMLESDIEQAWQTIEQEAQSK